MHVRTLAPVMAVAISCLTRVAASAADDGVEKGQALLEANCARCHASGADGASSHEKAPPFREVVTRYPLEDLEESLAEGIMSGHPDMPEISFKTDEIAAILGYLEQLKSNPAPPAAKPATEPATPSQP